MMATFTGGEFSDLSLSATIFFLSVPGLIIEVGCEGESKMENVC